MNGIQCYTVALQKIRILLYVRVERGSISRGDTVYIRRRPIQIKNLPEPKFRETERTHRSKSGQGNQLTKLNVRICDFTYVAESKRARTSQGVEHKPYVQFAVRYQKRIAKCTQMLKKET